MEMFYHYEEVVFMDEFYIWNNSKNGATYGWFEKGSWGDTCLSMD